MKYAAIYVCGFLMTPDGKHVLLMTKNYPTDYKGEGRLKWQHGLMNGVGGRAQEGETPAQAMIRTFQKETGVDSKTAEVNWMPFADLTYNDDKGLGIVQFFCAKAPTEAVFADAKSLTDETLHIIPVIHVGMHNIVRNLAFLTAMAALFQPGAYAMMADDSMKADLGVSMANKPATYLDPAQKEGQDEAENNAAGSKGTDTAPAESIPSGPAEKTPAPPAETPSTPPSTPEEKPEETAGTPPASTEGGQPGEEPTHI